MPHILEAGTDVASVVFYDPSQLPSDFTSEQLELVERLQEEGRLFWVSTGNDGAYCLHLFLCEEISDDLRPYLRDPIHIEDFKALGGQLTFCGAEYVNQEAPPGLGETVEVPAAVYDATFYRTEYDDLIERQVERRVGKFNRSMELVVGTLTGMGFVGALFIGPGLILVTGFALWSLATEGVLLLMAIGGLLLFATIPQFRINQEQSKEVSRKYPSIVASTGNGIADRSPVLSRLDQQLSIERPAFLRFLLHAFIGFRLVKAKFGDGLRSKSDMAMKNETLCKLVCHNICCLISAIYELGLTPTFWTDAV